MNLSKQIDPNAQEALENMKLEMANDLFSRVKYGGAVGGTMTKRLVEMGQKELLQNKKGE